MASELRPYGPGKFDTILDSVVHALTLDGCDAEAGDVTETGRWYGLLRGLAPDGPMADISATAILENQITDAELAFLREHSAGAIVSENDQGFVSVEYYTSREDLESAWAAIEQAENASGEPSEPEEGDITANDAGGPFFYLGKPIAANRAELRAWMEREDYAPNVWWISDHGNPHLITDLNDPKGD